MKLIHTADWHLGRIFHGVHLTKDQEYLLEGLIALVREEKPDAVIISGDVYDRAVPPPDAVNLLDHVLSELVLSLGSTVLVIPGNHDSPERLAFASRLLAGRNLHVCRLPGPSLEPVILEDSHGPVDFHLLPYSEPPAVKEQLQDETIHDHDSAMAAATSRIKKAMRPGGRSVLVAHAFVSGGLTSESERPLFIGAAGAVSSSHFEGFSYVALGHLHRCQHTGPGPVHYPGSLYKYSFSEASHAKSVNVVELDGKGAVTVRPAPLRPRHDVRVVRGYLKDLLKGPASGEDREDYLMVLLEDREPILDVKRKLQEVYPHVLPVERVSLDIEGERTGSSRENLSLTAEQLFGSFFLEVTGEDLTGDHVRLFCEAVKNVDRLEREGAR
ncbi:MAG: exonuclease SbcCD subunit D [Candidatus Eremiobacteraeota bacterium]|nr:exonuclease SbcCD subunit D [Candidatus Eremiobacteraeota bacterium]